MSSAEILAELEELRRDTERLFLELSRQYAAVGVPTRDLTEKADRRLTAIAKAADCISRSRMVDP